MLRACRSINSLAFSPDGTLLVSASSDDSARVWELATGLERALLLGHGSYALSVVLHPNGKSLASVGGDSLIRLWDTPISLDEAIRTRGEVHLRILRDGLVLKERVVRVPAELSGSALRLVGRHEGDQLLFQVNDLTPLQLQEVFAPRRSGVGVFSLAWPQGVELERLAAMHKKSATAPA